MLFMTHRDDNDGRGAKQGACADEDAHLVLAAQSGDRDAFETLIRRHERLVYRIAFCTVGNPEDAADLTQEILLKVWHGLPNFRKNARFLTWLTKLTRNACADFLRRKRRSLPTHPLSLFRDDDEEIPPGEMRDFATDSDPHEVFAQKERVTAVRAAMQKLSEEHRTVIVLRDIEGASYETIAAVLELEVGTVKSRLSRARACLKSILESEDFFGNF